MFNLNILTYKPRTGTEPIRTGSKTRTFKIFGIFMDES